MTGGLSDDERESISARLLSGPMAYDDVVRVIEEPGEAGLIVLPPEEALRRARRLPSPEDLAIVGLTSDEWDALRDALVQR